MTKPKPKASINEIMAEWVSPANDQTFHHGIPLLPPLGRRITDPGFRYTPSHATDLAATFARIRAGIR